MADFKGLTKNGERGFLASLRDAAFTQLLAAQTSLQEDAAILETGIARESTGMDVRLSAAVLYRLERKLCLDALVRVTEEALK